MSAPLVLFTASACGKVHAECLVCGWRGGWYVSLELAGDELLEHVWRCSGLPFELWEWPRADRASGF